LKKQEELTRGRACCLYLADEGFVGPRGGDKVADGRSERFEGQSPFMFFTVFLTLGGKGESRKKDGKETDVS